MSLFGGLFNRMYYGNPNQPELKKRDIENEGRFKLFFTVLGVRFWSLILINILFTVFWAPFLYVSVVFTANLETVMESIGPLLIIATMAVALQVTGPVWAGAVYVIRHWADDMHADTWSDLWLGVKKNWKSGVVLNLINGLVLIFLIVNVRFYFSGGMGMTNGGTILMGAMGWLMVICALVWFMMNMIMLPMAVRYDLKLRQVIKNSLLLAIAQLPRTLGVFILAGGLFIGLYFLFIMAPVISPLLLFPFIFFGLSFPLLIGCSYANFLFDKYMTRSSE